MSIYDIPQNFRMERKGVIFFNDIYDTNICSSLNEDECPEKFYYQKKYVNSICRYNNISFNINKHKTCDMSILLDNFDFNGFSEIKFTGAFIEAGSRYERRYEEYNNHKYLRFMNFPFNLIKNKKEGEEFKLHLYPKAFFYNHHKHYYFNLILTLKCIQTEGYSRGLEIPFENVCSLIANGRK